MPPSTHVVGLGKNALPYLNITRTRGREKENQEQHVQAESNHVQDHVLTTGTSDNTFHAKLTRALLTQPPPAAAHVLFAPRTPACSRTRCALEHRMDPQQLVQQSTFQWYTLTLPWVLQHLVLRRSPGDSSPISDSSPQRQQPRYSANSFDITCCSDPPATAAPDISTLSNLSLSLTFTDHLVHCDRVSGRRRTRTTRS